MKKTGFDRNIYKKKQTEEIFRRVEKFGNKLYLEFGGKMFDDYHASRVLPGFRPSEKMDLLCDIKDKVEIIFCIAASDIEKNKMRADFGITYDMDILRLIDNIKELGISINSVVITMFQGQQKACVFRKKLENRGIKTYIHKPIIGYPTNVDLILSSEGYGANPFIETSRPIVVVTGPGPGSGKLATCLSQVYHEHERGINAGYAKFETFPVWNLPLKHPVNLAYEAATADLNDVNMIDPFHIEAYEKTAVNYNRDIEAFPVVHAILSRVTDGKDQYKSPTDMGVNMAGYCILDDEVVNEAACQEIIRRYFSTMCDLKLGRVEEDTIAKIDLLFKQLDLDPTMRPVVLPCLERYSETGVPVMACEIPSGEFITGKTTELMCAAASMVLNSIKKLSGIADEIYLISPVVLEPILKLKRDLFAEKEGLLNLSEVLIALSISAATNPTAALVVTKLPLLNGCAVHSSHMIGKADEIAIRQLGFDFTAEAQFPSNELYFY